MKRLLFVLVFVLATNLSHAQGAYINLLRSDVKTRKLTIIAHVMQFTNEESKAFWPIFREYDAELSNIGDARIQLIKDYVQNYETITDGKAKELIQGALKLDERTTKLKKRYFRRFDRVLPSKRGQRSFSLKTRSIS